jgi:glycosyltransferase involved in cell wall biosynthesis
MHPMLCKEKNVKKIQIALIAPQPFVEARGTPMANLRVAQILADAGCDVDVITFPFGNDLQYPGISIIRCWRPPFIKYIRIGFSWAKILTDMSLMFTALSQAKRVRYDVIHGVEEGGLIGLVLSHITGAPLVYDMDSVMSHDIRGCTLGRVPGVSWFLRVLEGLVIRKASLIVTISESMAAYVKGIDPLKEVVVVPDIPLHVEKTPNPHRALNQIPEASKRKLIVYTGSLAKYQGIELLVLAMKEVVAVFREALLVIIGGDKKDIQRFSAYAHREGVSGNILFLGKKPPVEIPDFLSIADVLVSPRRWSINPPAKLYTYMHSGKPIVATDIPAHNTVVDSESAFLVPPTPYGLAKGIIQALSDKQTCLRLANRAREIVSSITPGFQAQRLLEGYRRLLPGLSAYLGVEGHFSPNY